jgi:hypothetical protein
MLRTTIAAGLCAPIFLFAQNTGTITGKVTDAATHQPVPGVHVSSTTGGPGSNFVGSLTGVDGSYTLENVPAGAVHMILNLDGYKLLIDPPGRGASFPLGIGETLRRDFTMHPQARIYGRLIDRDTGKPITGHTVSAVLRESRPGITYVIDRSGEQKADRFNIGNLDPGDYLIEIDPDEQPAFVFPADASPKPAPKKVYGRAWYTDVPSIDSGVSIHLAEGESRNIEISLTSRETHSVSGTLTAPRELEGQPITLALDAGRPLEGWVTMMQAPGTFRIDNLAPGKYRLALTGGKPANGEHNLRDYTMAMLDAGGPGKVPAVNGVGDYAFEIGDSDIENYKIALLPYASVHGEFRMLEKDAQLPAKLGVFMAPTDLDTAIFIRAASVHDGQFRQDWLRPGDYWPELNGLPRGYAIAQILFDGATPLNTAMTLSTPDTPLIFVLTSRPGSVSGVVRDSNQDPVRGATVVLLPDPLPNKPDPETIKSQQSGDDGGFVFSDLAPGRYRAFVLTDADRARQGDPEYLRQRAAGAERIEATAGQAARVELKQ